MDGPSYPLHPNDHGSVADSAPTAADAAVLQLAEAASAKQSAKPCSALPPQIHDDACAILTEAAKDIAVTKNVRLVPGQESEVAAMAIKALDTAIIYGLIRCEAGSVALAAATVNCLLDLIAACEVIRIVRGAEGFDQLNPDQTLADAKAWIARQVANDTGDKRLRWPEPIDMAIRYFRARSSGPVAIQFSGEVRAAYLVDPLLLGAGRRGERGPRPALASVPSGAVTDDEAAQARAIPARAQADGFMPEPLLIRCPPFSHVHRTPMPDGRRVQKLSDTDKLDGTIDIALFEKASASWRAEQARCLREIAWHQAADQSYLEEGARLLDLAHSARKLFAKQQPHEKRKLLNFVLSNSTWRGGELTPTFRQPFDLLAKTTAIAAQTSAKYTRNPSEHPSWLRMQS